jgi:hypothetical protein
LPLTTYTTYDEVRAALGVDAKELEDATLGLDMYSHGLLAEFEEIHDDIETNFATVDAIDEGTRTSVQARFWRAAKLFAVYAVAKHLLSSLPLFAPKSITDGKAAITRDSNQPHELTAKRISAQYDRFRALLEDRHSEYRGSGAVEVVRPVYAVASVPTSDPVTGT